MQAASRPLRCGRPPFPTDLPLTKVRYPAEPLSNTTYCAAKSRKGASRHPPAFSAIAIGHPLPPQTPPRVGQWGYQTRMGKLEHLKY